MSSLEGGREARAKTLTNPGQLSEYRSLVLPRLAMNDVHEIESDLRPPSKRLLLTGLRNG